MQDGNGVTRPVRPPDSGACWTVVISANPDRRTDASKNLSGKVYRATEETVRRTLADERELFKSKESDEQTMCICIRNWWWGIDAHQ